MNRYNVIMIIFDLHTTTASERHEYRVFRKHLIRNGYSFMQESVYVKLIRSHSSVTHEISELKLVTPADGSIMAVPLSLENFKRIYTVLGNEFDVSGFSDPVVVF